MGEEVGSGVEIRAVELGSVGASVGAKVGSGVGLYEGVLGSVVDRGAIVGGWQALSAAKMATNRK